MNFSFSPSAFIQWLQTWPPEGIIGLLIISCGAAVCFLTRFFGAAGLIVYMALAIIIANLQLHVATYFSFFPEPVALGTIVFSSTFIVSSLLTEYYGKAQAQKAVWLSMGGVIILTLFMVITLGFTPAPGFQAAHQAIQTLFVPAPALIAASLVAYVVGQYNEIWVFEALSRLTRKKFLWLRSFVGPLVGAFIDNLFFSVLAWVVFAPYPLPWETVLYTYVLGTYILRVTMAGISVLFMYGIKKIIRR